MAEKHLRSLGLLSRGPTDSNRPARRLVSHLLPLSSERPADRSRNVQCFLVASVKESLSYPSRYLDLQLV